ncbi:unnamed protein product, partial [Musa hybrid cultivar]
LSHRPLLDSGCIIFLLGRHVAAGRGADGASEAGVAPDKGCNTR